VLYSFLLPLSKLNIKIQKSKLQIKNQNCFYISTVIALLSRSGRLFMYTRPPGLVRAYRIAKNQQQDESDYYGNQDFHPMLSDFM